MKGGETASIEENKRLTQREAEEVWNQKNLDAIDKFYSKNFVNHDPTDPEVNDFESYKKSAISAISAFPDLKLIIDDMIAEGNKVVAPWTTHGTDKEALPGIPPTGKEMRWTGIVIFRFAEGKIEEAWWAQDKLSMFQRPWVIPSPKYLFSLSSKLRCNHHR